MPAFSAQGAHVKLIYCTEEVQASMGWGNGPAKVLDGDARNLSCVQDALQDLNRVYSLPLPVLEDGIPRTSRKCSQAP